MTLALAQETACTRKYSCSPYTVW